MLSQLRSSLSCVRCEQLLSEPKSLPCGHVVCERCVTPIACAVCRRSCPPVAELPVAHSFLALQLLEFYKTQLAATAGTQTETESPGDGARRTAPVRRAHSIDDLDYSSAKRCTHFLILSSQFSAYNRMP